MLASAFSEAAQVAALACLIVTLGFVELYQWYFSAQKKLSGELGLGLEGSKIGSGLQLDCLSGPLGILIRLGLCRGKLPTENNNQWRGRRRAAGRPRRRRRRDERFESSAEVVSPKASQLPHSM